LFFTLIDCDQNVTEHSGNERKQTELPEINLFYNLLQVK